MDGSWGIKSRKRVQRDWCQHLLLADLGFRGLKNFFGILLCQSRKDIDVLSEEKQKKSSQLSHFGDVLSPEEREAALFVKIILWP